MSSRICRVTETPSIQPIQWREPGGTDSPQHHGRTRQQRADATAGERSERAREMEARVAAGYQQGLEASTAAVEAAAAQAAQARLEPVLTGLAGVVAELAGARKKLRAEAEEATVSLAIAIARRVLNRELASDPEALLGLVMAAFRKCDARETHKLRVSPQDAGAIRENRERLTLPPGVEIIADVSLGRGSAIFETSRGELDASLDTQLGEIERGLTDVMKRRNR